MPRQEQEPLHHFVVFQIKSEITSPRLALKSFDSLTKIDLDPKKAEGCELYIRPPREKLPPWVSFLNEGTLNPLPPLLNANTAAVLFVPATNRLLAYCFGRGRFLLRPDAYEVDFGLKVALNSVDVDKLRSLDSRAFEQLTVQTRRQSSKAAPLETFGLNITQDLLRAVTGEPRDPKLAIRVSGRDALSLTTRLTFTDLSRQATQLVGLRDSTAYRADFAWVDQLREERDPAILEALNTDLLNRLRNGNTDGMHIAPPSIIDFEQGVTFSFNQDSHTVADPTVDMYLTSLRHREALNLSILKRHELGVHIGDSDEPEDNWSVFKSLVVETTIDDRRFVLTEGLWYALASQLVEELRAFMMPFEKSGISLPPCKTSEDEKAYNIRVAAEHGWALTDRQLIKPAGARTPVEFCDIFTPDRQLIHVKQRASSSTLSHLFAQGYVSAEALLYDRTFREQAGRITGSLASLISVGELNAREFEVAFAIVGGNRRGWPHSLPFFTQLHFRSVAQKLHRFGFRVSLIHAHRI